MKKSSKIMVAMMLVVTLFLSPATSFVAKAYTLEGTSTSKNNVYDSNNTHLQTTIQTNYHAGSVTGFIMDTPESTVNDLLGITKDMIQTGANSVLYVTDSQCGDAAKTAIANEANKYGATAISYLEVMLFKFADGWNKPITTIDAPVKMTVGIPVSEISGDRDYAMVRIHDGEVMTLLDLDTDVKTVTFESSKFSVYALVYGPKGAFAPKAAEVAKPAPVATQPVVTKTAPATAAVASTVGGELDDVPKTGETTVFPLALVTMFFAGIFLLSSSRKTKFIKK